MSELNRFVIVGTQRTGTTLIRTSLSSHPDICCYGEVFKLGAKPYSHVGGYWEFSRRSTMNRIGAVFRPEKSVATYLDKMYEGSGYGAVGFKLMLSHCISRPYVWPLVVEHDVSIVWVRRRNYLKTLVSRRAAEESGVYHVSQSLKSDAAVNVWSSRKIRLSEESLISDLEKIAAEDVSWRARLVGHANFHEIFYENYVTAMRSANRELLTFLKVRDYDLNSDLKKVNPAELHDVIDNFEKVEKALSNSRFASMLYDE